MAGGRHYYRGIGGSAALVTVPLAAATEVARAEALVPGEMLRVPVGQDLLGSARVRARFAPLPLEAFDRTAGLLEAVELAAYLQLLRLAYGEGRNFCRAGKRELMRRLSLSERRLNRALAALVEKRFLRPLHRDNRGTLWRVHLPREAFGEPVGDDVLLGAAWRGAPAHLPEARRPGSGGGAGEVARLARALARARGQEDGAGALAAAADEIRGLLEDGHGLARVEACIRALSERRHAAAGTGASP